MIASSPKTERYRRSLRPLSRRSSMPSIATLAPESPSACPSTNARKSIRPTSKSLANNSRSTRSIRSPESAACSTYRRIFSSRVWVLRKAGSCETIYGVGLREDGLVFTHTLPFSEAQQLFICWHGMHAMAHASENTAQTTVTPPGTAEICELRPIRIQSRGTVQSWITHLIPSSRIPLSIATPPIMTAMA